MTPALSLAASLFLAQWAGGGSPPSTAGGQAFPVAQGQTVNVLQWEGNQLPKVYERSAQLPLSDEEVAKLAKAGFDSAQLVKMIEERRCACDASAEGLIKLKSQGVPKDVLSAISLHGLKPNRALNLELTLDFVGDGNEAREGTLYFFIEDGDIARVFSLPIGELLSKQHQHEDMVSKSDFVLARRVRRIQLAGQVPLKKYGTHRVLVAASANPTLSHPSQLTELERSKSQAYTLEYPRVSLSDVCRLRAGYRRDPVLTYKWLFLGSRFECEWD